MAHAVCGSICRAHVAAVAIAVVAVHNVTSCETLDTPTTIKPKKHRWIPAKYVDEQQANRTVTSVFTMLYHVPKVHELPEDMQHYIVAPEHAAKGFAVRLGTGKVMQRDRSLSHYKVKPVMGPRVLLCAHWRGALEIPGGHRDVLPVPAAEPSSLAPGGGQPLVAVDTTASGTAHSRVIVPTSQTEPVAAPVKELPAVAAARELVEEAGVVMPPNRPLSWDDDAVAVMLNDDGTARWVLFARQLSSKEFDQAIAAGVTAPTYLSETYGNVAAHTIVTYAGDADKPADRVYGLPRMLQLLASWQCDMLLSGLQAVGVFNESDVAEVTTQARAWHGKGGPWIEGGPSGGLTRLADVPRDAPALRSEIGRLQGLLGPHKE